MKSTSSLKLILSTLLTLSFMGSQSFASVPPSSNSREEFVISKAILIDSNRKPVCVIDLSKKPEFAPAFAPVADENYQSPEPINLRNCDTSEALVISETSQAAAMDVKTAALPAVVLAGLAICEMTGLVGGALGAATAAGLFAASGNVPGTIVGTLEGFVRLAGKPRLIRYTFGGPIGFICGSIGDAAAYTGVYYILEKAKASGVFSR